MIAFAPGTVKRAQQRAGTHGVDDASIFPHPVGEQSAPPGYPLRGKLAQEKTREFRDRGGGQPQAGIVRESLQTAGAKAGIGQVGHRLFPTGLTVVVVQPDPVDLIALERGSESVHPVAPIARMRGTQPLPPVRRRAGGPVGSDRGGLRMCRQIAALMQGVELGEHPRALTFDLVDAFVAQAGRAHPEGIDAVVVQALPPGKPLGGYPAIEAAHLDMRSLRHQAVLSSLSGRHAVLSFGAQSLPWLARRRDFLWDTDALVFRQDRRRPLAARCGPPSRLVHCWPVRRIETTTESGGSGGGTSHSSENGSDASIRSMTCAPALCPQSGQR